MIYVRKKQETCAILVSSKNEQTRAVPSGTAFLFVLLIGVTPYAKVLPLLWPDASRVV